MCNVTLEYTTTHSYVMGQTRPGNTSPTFHTHHTHPQPYDADMMVVSQKLGRKCIVPAEF